ncbi:MAG: hypothetical protein HY248_05880 [Fimbriimonas ginsengisoli]|nr:hypothetical protein [Fimbriimonas ginsengisoli]
MGFRLVIWSVLLVAGLALTAAEPQPKTILKTETFDRDPGWEGHNNRITPKRVFMVKQDFGYSTTHFAGLSAGESAPPGQTAVASVTHPEPRRPRRSSHAPTASMSGLPRGLACASRLAMLFSQRRQPSPQTSCNSTLAGS